MKTTQPSPPSPSSQASQDETQQESTSIGGQVKSLANDISILFSKELSLAKAEFKEAASHTKAGLSALAIGTTVLQAGLVVLLLAAVYGLALYMDLWLAALIIGLAAVIIGAILLSSAKKKLEPNEFVPERTIRSVEKDAETTKRAIQ